MVAFLTKPTPHAEAAKLIRDKKPVIRAVFDSLEPEIRARAFTVAMIDRLDQVERIQNAVAQWTEGRDWNEVRDEIAREITPAGSDEEQTKAGLRKAQLILRTEGRQAVATAQFRTDVAMQDDFPWWQYKTRLDDKVRDRHAELHDKIFRADDPFWLDHYPPWDWNCRCYVVKLTDYQVRKIRQADADLPPEKRRIMEGAMLAKLNDDGQLLLPNMQLKDFSSPARRAAGQVDDAETKEKARRTAYRFNPAGTSINLAALRARYSDATWAIYEQNAKATKLPDGRTVWEYINAEQAA